MAASAVNVRVGARVQIKDKDLLGTVAYVGLTEFAAGKWIGVVLDEPKGKNNGVVQGKQYFKCDDKHGMFVRQTQIVLADDEGGGSSRGSPAPSPRGAATPTQQQEATPPKSTATPTKIPGSKSAIPKPGAGGSRLSMGGQGRGPTGSRQPSFTNLKREKKEVAGSSGQSGGSGAMVKEKSFVEKGFVETMKQPTVEVKPAASSESTPAKRGSIAATAAATPQPFVGSPALQERLEEKVANLQAQQELQQSKETIKDLEEKLETVKIKRAKDLEKLKEFEKMKFQHEQLLEFKSRIMESQAQLQKELQKAKHDAKEAQEAKEKVSDETAELAETVEMATLDKEMAEEKAETLQIELEAAKEKIEELQVDLDIIKAEMGDGGGGGGGGGEAGISNFEAKQQAAQNEKLRETLVRMRDLLAHEKNEAMKMTKDLEEKTTQAADLKKHNEKLIAQNEELEATIADLQEQVDAALGAEEMVENLTTKCLDWEEKYAAISEEKDDLEKLYDLNEELQENAREVELQIREDLDIAQGKIREVERARDAAHEIIADHQATITKFRDLVAKVQEQNLDLRSELEKETNKPVSATPAEMIDFKKMFAESKAHSKAIDMELRTCEVQQANQHVAYLTSFMSDRFMGRGGDNEAVLVLLLMPRMIWKAEILIAQVKENFTAPATMDGDALLKGHDVEKYTFGAELQHYMETLVAQLRQFQSALDTCSSETFLKMGTLYPEMSVHERSGLDFYIDLLRKSQLDENVPIDNIEKSLQYFQHIYPMHLGSERIDHPSFVTTHLKAITSGLEALSAEFGVAKILLPAGQEGSEAGTLIKTSEAEVTELLKVCKGMKRRAADSHSISFPASSALKFTDVCRAITPLVKAMHVFGRSAAQHAGLQGEASLPATKLSELLHSAIDKVYEFNDAGLDTVKKALALATSKMGELSNALQEGEWDQDPTTPAAPKPTPPVQVRCTAYKAEIKEAEGMRQKLEYKDGDMKELKLALRAKGEELSEMQVRINRRATPSIRNLILSNLILRAGAQRQGREEAAGFHPRLGAGEGEAAAKSGRLRGAHEAQGKGVRGDHGPPAVGHR